MKLLRSLTGGQALLWALMFSPLAAAQTLPVPNISELPQVSNQATDLMAQESSAAVVSVTGIQLNPTNGGLEIVLETQDGKALVVDASPFTPQGNTLIAEIPNAVLALPEGRPFQAVNPTADITQITVEQQTPTSLRVQIAGNNAPPTTKVTLKASASVAGTPSVSTEEAGEEEELVVTGEQKQPEGYRVPNSSVGTKTDTPLRDVPQSIQVVPQQVIEDQGVTRISDALRNVSGVIPRGDFGGATDSRFNIRGFDTNSSSLRNGFRVVAPEIAPSSIERVEVLKGPASVLYGQFEPGGVVNFVTKQPQADPSHNLEFTAGQFDYYSPSVDLTGPLTPDKKLLYRLTASYENFGSFRDFVNGEQLSIAPTLSYQWGKNTTLKAGYEFFRSDQTFDGGLPIDPISFDLPRSRFIGEPGDFVRSSTHNLNVSLDHKFNDNIQLRTGFGASFRRVRYEAFRVDEFDPTTNQVARFFGQSPYEQDDYSWQTDLIAKFKTGPVQHQFLVGVELAHSRLQDSGSSSSNPSPIDVLNPIYGTPIPSSLTDVFSNKTTTDTVGVYLQDQVTLLPNLKLLVGGRYDFSRTDSNFNFISDGEGFFESNQFNDQAFSPRVGLVYQPIEPVSLYASYSRSFVPNNALTSTGELIEPTRGTQFEVGAKVDFGKFTATLAAYQITKTNIPTPDPANPDFSIPVGEARSRGLELDVSAEIKPGWNMIASAFVNDTAITKDNSLSVGDRLVNAPRNGASLWTTYEIQTGDLKGLGFGAGLFYVGDSEAELPNGLVLPAYVRADASIFYKRDKWRVGLNFKNLFNTRYFESGSELATIRPGEPFTVQGTISFEF
jgi:iron complex outermembrane recepter protein